MKISVTLKDPDGFGECVDEDVKASLADSGLPEDEQEAVVEKRLEKVWKELERWVDCQEYVTIDFDTEAGTATVRPRQ